MTPLTVFHRQVQKPSLATSGKFWKLFCRCFAFCCLKLESCHCHFLSLTFVFHLVQLRLDCCTDGFATKALDDGDHLCIWFYNDGRSGLGEGIRFYESASAATDITPKNYEKAGRKAKVCIKIGCGPPDCKAPCNPIIGGKPGADGLVCGHDDNDSCYVIPPPSYGYDPCYSGTTLCKAVPPLHETCGTKCLNTYASGKTVCQHDVGKQCRTPDASYSAFPHCVAGETICTSK